jgi:ferric enterobactin receptor
MLIGALTTLGMAPPVLGQGRNIRGVVRDSVSGETLPSALVAVVGTQVRTNTDAFGRFALLGVPSGRHTLQVKRLGYAPRSIELRDSTQRSLTVFLVPVANRIDTLTIRAAPHLVSSGDHAGVIEISPSELGALPSVGETDLFRSLQLLPGVSGASDANSGLSIRGGTSDENLVLLDGMTVYHVDHFFGFFSAFNTDAIKDVRLMKGGYGAKWGGRTSGVIDMVGKSGDNAQFGASAGLSLLSARSVTEVPLGGKGSWLLSMRRSYTDIIRTGLYNSIFDAVGGEQDPGNSGQRVEGGRVLNGRRPPQQTVVPDFYFYDLNSKLSFVPSASDILSVSFYAGQDRLDQSQSLTGGQGGVLPGGGQGPRTDVDLVDKSDWGNTGISGRWSRSWGARFTSDLLGAYSEYYSKGNRSTGAAGLAFGFREDNRVRDAHVRLDNEWLPFTSSTVSFGAEITRNQLDYTYAQLQGDSVRGVLDLGGDGVLSAAYAQYRWSPSRHIDLTAGLRATSYDRTGQRYVEPRASANLLLTDHWRLKGAWGRYSQFVKRVENENIQQGSRDFWVLANDTMPVARAEHRIIGGSYENDDFLFDVEAYQKVLDGVSQFSTRARTRPDQALSELFFSGTGDARGIEVMAQKKRGTLTGWVSYTLASVDYELSGFNGGKSFPASQDQRHEVKGVGAYQLGQWILASTWVYGSGKPYTLPEAQYTVETLDGEEIRLIHVGAKNGARLPQYHRLDVSGSRRFESERWFCELNLSVFNVYGRKNVRYRSFDLTQTPLTVTDIGTLGFTPSVGLRFGLR